MTTDSSESRRRFLSRARKVAIATPPTLAVLLIADGRNYAMAQSGGGPGNFGGGAGNYIDELFSSSASEYRQAVGNDIANATTEYDSTVQLDNMLGYDDVPLVPIPQLGDQPQGY
jgi:hypothetical protein